MAKVTAPILSMRARGQIGKSQVYASWRGVPYARQLVTPTNPNTSGQQATRGVFSSMQDLWKRLGSLSRDPWTLYAKGKPFTDRNAITSKNVAAMRGQADRQLYVGSPGARGGVAPTAIAAVGGAASGEIDVTVTSPPTPTGWTLVSVICSAIEDGDPATLVPSPIAEAENAAPVEDGDTDVTLTGLTGGTSYVVAAWLEWTKSDGSSAYGASLVTTASATV